MKARHEYSVNLVWSDEDQAYLAIVPELPGCMADGPSREEALGNVAEVVRHWIEVATEEGREIPAPLSMKDNSLKLVEN